jgi:hypothetical protein
MAQAEEKTEKSRKVVIQKNKICNYGRNRYLYENAIAREPRYTLRSKKLWEFREASTTNKLQY